MFTGNIEALLRLIGTYDKIQIPLYWKIARKKPALAKEASLVVAPSLGISHICALLCGCSLFVPFFRHADTIDTSLFVS